MVYRPVDSSGDMIPISSAGDLVKDADAIVQVIQSRIRLLYGEWWEDEELGFSVPDFLFDGLRAGNIDELESYINEYILETIGVTSSSTTITMVGRTAKVVCDVETDYGELEEEVTEDELLRAIY